jgi:hypothetical protein
MSGKRDISMSPEEIDLFLRGHDLVIVAGGSKGPVEGAAGNLLYEGGEVAFELCSDDPVVALIESDKLVCCAVEQFPSYYEIKGVMLHGRARRRPEIESGNERFAVFDLVIEKTVSFDFGKLVHEATPSP